MTSSSPIEPPLPDANGHFGPFGGRFVPETLMQPLLDLETTYRRCMNQPEFLNQFHSDLSRYVGRPTPLYHAKRWSKKTGGAQLYLKREDLNHTGAHKINNTVGQALLALQMGKTRLIAETGAGQHGVATATVAARFGLTCVVYMGANDIERQSMNVFRMKILGADVIPVTAGSRTLKDAMNEALRDWVTHIDDTFYVIGTVAGPHPYPMMVRDFQSIIGRETKQQLLNMTSCLPDAVVACVGGGSNAIGIFYEFIRDKAVKLYGIEAGGDSRKHAASLCLGRVGVLHGSRTYLLMEEGGQIASTHSIAAGLDYPGVGPEHAWLKETGRVLYETVTDEEAVAAFYELSRLEGIIPALESAHATAYAKKLAAQMGPDQTIVVCLSGRGDKDLAQVSGLGIPVS